jgi:hypothetical protein
VLGEHLLEAGVFTHRIEIGVESEQGTVTAFA